MREPWNYPFLAIMSSCVGGVSAAAWVFTILMRDYYDPNKWYWYPVSVTISAFSIMVFIMCVYVPYVIWRNSGD